VICRGGGRTGRWAALLLAAGAASAVLPAIAGSSGNSITGAWASTTGAERLIFLPGGYFRTCFAGGKTGNAAMGRWQRVAAGRYTIEFTHTARPACNAPPQAIRQHPASILGQVLVQRGELSLFVSGEFPPDVYRPATPAALR
jgi:hypothetical protein